MISNLTAGWLTVSAATAFTETCVDVQVELFEKYAMYVSAKEQSLAVRKSNVRSQPQAGVRRQMSVTQRELSSARIR